MVLKDYYNILQVLPTATGEEIKKAYRKLALQYHPDTTNNDAKNHIQFLEIKEAYEVLFDTQKRQSYHYKNFHRGYKEQTNFSPEIILQQTQDLAALIAVLDPYKIDYDRLSFQITELLNTSNSNTLHHCNDIILVEKVVTNILKCTLLLQYQLALPINQKLILIANNNPALIIIIEQQRLQQKRLFYWHKYKLFVALIGAIILCICFYCLT